ncbi:MAG: NAD(P)H-quinone dehydrogenase [Streptosporangiales bacterium]|nr:NAD(P)H-quinone dehydrogenase [Streptosporangiales bacterium]MBO0891955.1 NAD(P)H-quinone dehydrogenase [Acidothermales bacterium]
MARVAIIGGGPGGYEAALVAAQLGADVTLVERDGPGGGCVLADCVPSKTLIATAESVHGLEQAGTLGLRLDGGGVGVDIARVNERVRDLAKAQSADIAKRVTGEGVTIVPETGRLLGPGRVEAGAEELRADVVLVSVGARPRMMPGVEVDGERILTWRQVYDLDELPEHLVVVGSGVTGAEFASGYLGLGARVTLVSSRDRVLPHEDPDAAAVLEDVFSRRGMDVVGRARARTVERTADGVVVRLVDGRAVEGSHCLLAIGSVPATDGIGLGEAGVAVDERGFVDVDRVSRTSVPGVYAAGDCTGVLMLASVAAMQGRIAMWHALGEAVAPLRLSTVAANVFTDPEIASVGVTQAMVDSGSVDAQQVLLPLATNPRGKMQELHEGFVKLYCRSGTGVVLGGVIVAPKASELVLTLSLAVRLGLTVGQLAHTFAVYPSLTGSITEAARQLMTPLD